MVISDASSDEEPTPADPLGPNASEADQVLPKPSPCEADCPMSPDEERNHADPSGPSESVPDPALPEYSPCETDYPMSPEDTTSPSLSI